MSNDNVKSTPGPWIVVEFEDPNKSTIAQVGGLLIVVDDDVDGDFGDEEADATLVAAAPEMLAMLEHLHSVAEIGFATRLDVEELIAKAKGGAL